MRINELMAGMIIVVFNKFKQLQCQSATRLIKKRMSFYSRLIVFQANIAIDNFTVLCEIGVDLALIQNLVAFLM